MKGFLSKVTAVLSAVVIMMGTLAVLPEEWLPKFGIVSSAANSYSEFSNVPCGMNCKMSLSNGVLTISGSGPMFNLLYNDIGEMYSGLGDYYDWTYYNDYITSCKSYIKEVKFSNSITYIGSYAFSGSNITNISLPNSITDIGSWAFSDCSSLSKVTMNKVESIGYGCFSYCPKLTEVSFPNTLKTIGMEAFVCDGLITVGIPESVKELNIDAFSGMSSLQKIVIPKNTEINDFLGLNNSPNVTIYSYSGSSSEIFAKANNIPFIALDEDISTNNGKCGENAFWELSANGQLLITGTGKMYDFQENAAPWSSLVDQIKEINVADGVEYIGKNAFNGCLSAKNITLGSTVSDIGYYSFKGCSSLDSISLPEGIEWIISYAFYDCDNLTHIYLPESATLIGNFTFYNCKSLEKIVIPYNVKAIGLAAFNGCEKLKSIVIPDSVTTIPPKESCFNNSNDLTIYGNTGSYAETYANDNNIPFIALDTIEGKMLYKIELKSGQQIYSYLFVDMDHDGQKEMIASVYNEKTNKYDIWYCSSNLLNCRLVYSTSMCFLDYCKIDSIDYNNETHVIINSGNNFGDGQYANILALYDDEITILFDERGSLYKSTNLVILSVYRTALPNQPATIIKTNYMYDKDSRTYIVVPDSSSDDEITIPAETKAFINQHYFAAIPQYWNKFHEVQDTKEYYDDSRLNEYSHAASLTLDFASKVFTINIDGVMTDISANAYNAILLDMFMEVEGINSENYENAIAVEKSIDDAMEPILDTISMVSGKGEDYLKLSKLNGTYDQIKLDIKKEYKNADFNVLNIFKKYGIGSDITDAQLKASKFSDTSDVLGELGNVVDGIDTAFTLFENLNHVIEAQALLYMDKEYIELLWEIYHAAEKYDGNSWEIIDLKNALLYEIKFRENYDLYMTWETVKGANTITGFSGEMAKAWSNYLEKYMVSSFGSEFFSKFSAAQVAVKIGMFASNQLFDLNNADDLYYKGKAYGVLEDILREILDKKAAELKLCEDGKTYSESQINSMHSSAKAFDRLFKMYVFVESNGCQTYSEYAKSLLPLDDNWLKQAVKFVGDGIEIAVRTLIDPLHGISKAYQDTVKVHFNAIYYQRRADFVKRNLYCHGSIFDTADGSTQYFKMVSENYLRLLEADAQLAAVMCPVEVEVYNGSNELVGVISETRNTIENSSEIYVYRNNSADANIIVCPSDYSIKIKGLNNGEMTVLSNYYTNSEITRSVAYSKVPITDGYVAEIDITADSDSLTDNTGRNLSSDPITAFVERLYLNILNRPSDPSKVTHIDNLNNGESACKVAFDFVFSSEFAELPISNEERVRRMYLTFLNREPDPAGLADWTAVLDNGCSIGHIFYGFTQSNEFTEICEAYGINRGTWDYTENRDRSSKLTAFVSRLYTKAMGRAYDVNGLNDHTGNYLENRDLYQLAYNFIFSSEFIEKNLTNEEFVDVMYRTFFDREADSAGKADWLDRMANQGYTREDVLAGFVGSQECINLVARFGI